MLTILEFSLLILIIVLFIIIVWCCKEINNYSNKLSIATGRLTVAESEAMVIQTKLNKKQKAIDKFLNDPFVKEALAKR